MAIQLSFATSDAELVRPLIEGRVGIEGIELLISVCAPSEIFWRQMHHRVFDVMEMAIPSLLVANEHGDEMVALPAFPARRFMQIELRSHPESGIEGPEDIAHKRVAVVEYAQASAVWTRGILHHDFGVAMNSVTWVVERGDEVSYASAAGFTPPAGMTVEHVGAGETIRTLLERHAVDVAPAAGPRAATVVERTRMAGTAGAVELRPVFADPLAECRRFVAAHGYVPTNHCYALRAGIEQAHPGAAAAIYDALVRSKHLAERERTYPEALLFAGEFAEREQRDFGSDPYPYGLQANEAMLRDLIGHCHEQGLIAAAPEPAALFPAELAGT